VEEKRIPPFVYSWRRVRHRQVTKIPYGWLHVFFNTKSPLCHILTRNCFRHLTSQLMHLMTSPHMTKANIPRKLSFFSVRLCFEGLDNIKPFNRLLSRQKDSGNVIHGVLTYLLYLRISIDHEQSTLGLLALLHIDLHKQVVYLYPENYNIHHSIDKIAII